MPVIRLSATFKPENKSQIADLHKALTNLKMPVSAAAVEKREIDHSTREAIRKFQADNELTATGKLNNKTIKALNIAAHDSFITTNKYRTNELQSLLQKANLKVDKAEAVNRTAGKTTRKAIKDFQKKNGLAVDGKVSEDVLNKLHEVAIKEKLKSNTQKGILHSTLQKVSTIAGLNIQIAPDELKAKKMGTTSVNVIKAFQEKYKLPVTGEVDKATLDKLKSVAASKGTFVKRISTPVANQLAVVSKSLRINKVSPQVNSAQKALSFLGYKISQKEFNTKTYGKSTRAAVLAFQKSKGLAETGHLEKRELKLLNAEILRVNPGAIQYKYRIRGSVRDELWQRQPNMVIRIFEKLIDGESPQPLMTKKNLLNGFFDITYTPPINPKTGQVKEKFHLLIKLYKPVDNNAANDQLVTSQIHYNVNRIHWVNFTAGDAKYAGDSDFTVTQTAILKAIGDLKIPDLHETADDKQISQLGFKTGLDTDDIMRMILSHLVAANVNKPAPLSAEVFYAFIRQNLPPDLPGDLLRGTSDWETIGMMTERAASGIIFMNDDMQQQVLANAISQNLVSRTIAVNKDAILQELKNQRSAFALTKPILTGNQNLKTLLEHSDIKAQHYPAIAAAFIEQKGINTGFWNALNAQSALIGKNDITDFTTTVELGNIAKNHVDTVTFLKSKIGTDPKIKSASSFAKLDLNDMIALINENGKKIPDNIPGNTPDEKVAAYAASIVSKAAILYPAVSLVAAIKRSNTDKISKISEIENFIDTQPDLAFKQQNIDKFLIDNPGIHLDNKTREEVKVVQRVHKLTNDPSAAAAMIAAGLHSSMQIYFTGKSNLKKLLAAKGISDDKTSRLFEFAKIQYLQVIGRIIEFLPSTNKGTPAAIVPQTYTSNEIKAAIGDIPNLESLFGSLDYCDCEHCKSLYGPAAYLTDILRFLKQHPAIDTTKTVKDILIERRPDIQNIKLNCENTNTPLPYIDLVCEILENNIAPSQTDFSYQTTLTAKELRAVPQYVRTDAYKSIATANFPMSSSFNLFQEEARAYLNYLQVSRHKLMEAFQDISNPVAKVPSDADIAAEYFGISSFEKNLILISKPNVADQNIFWKLDTSQAKIPVKDFMNRTQLNYEELLNLLMVRFLNDPNAPNRSEIERLSDSCDTGTQQINNLTKEKFDLMHRFIRLWRKTGWEMWQLDLLIRTFKIGNNLINDHTLAGLWRFKLLQEKLNLPFEILLAFYFEKEEGGVKSAEINREVRIKADKPDVKINPLYKNLFQNIAVTNPLDSKFKAVNDDNTLADLDPTIVFSNENPGNYTPVPTVLSALALRQTDFDQLIGKTDGLLSVNTLTILLRYTYFARALKLNIKDTQLLLSVTGITDPFADLETTYNCIRNLELIRSSNMSLTELDYVLNYNTESPVGFREEIWIRMIESLRQGVDSNKEKIDKLQLSEVNKTDIISFNGDALTQMADADLIAALQPLQNILNPVLDNFKDAGFSAAESVYITDYNLAGINTDSKSKLVSSIKNLQQSLSNMLNIKSQVASSFNLTDLQADVLLNNLSLLPATNNLLVILKNESLIEKKEDGTFKKEISQVNFPDLFKAYFLLHKASLVIQKLKLSDADLKWFIQLDNANAVHTLKFSTLPVDHAGGPNDFSGWLNLYQFLNFKSGFPEPDNASIRSVLTLANDSTKTKNDIFEEIVKLTRWSKEDIQSLDAGLHLNHATGSLDYTHAEVYCRLKKCFDQMRLTGVNANIMLGWAKRNDTVDDDIKTAQQTRQSVKSKYEQDDWLQKITPVHDSIRERKRDALIKFHIENAQRTQAEKINVAGKDIPNPLYWFDPNALFKYFLIDVEMSACQLTSRIKQAISSVQLFVQRCFLNLENRYVKVTEDEKEDVASADAWSQWKWMKNYRIWEANRKVFFYPENWIEPELRDDKSPFFEELENEIMQNEITKDNVETAFVNYLHKVDEVANLEVCGLYHEMENLTGDGSIYEINTVHVVGRSKAIPHIYYYRKYDMNYCVWTAWEKIDVDINGDHLVPVVYNRKLHLFWLQFMEKPMKVRKVPPAQPSTGPQDAPEPMQLLEIQLGWTIKKTSGWTAKKISKQKLTHPWQRPQHSYNLKPYYFKRDNELYLDIYISTSRDFNGTVFYDPYQHKKVKLTKNPFNETFLPWHSSSFIFNGEVKQVALKGLTGFYHLEPNVSDLTDTDSYNYIHTNYDPQGLTFSKLAPVEFGPRLRLPGGMHFNYNQLTNNQGANNRNPNQLRVLENTNTVSLLNNASSGFSLVITQQDLQLNTVATSHPLFYQDKQRVFFIKPEWETILNNYGQVMSHNRKYHFFPFYHPYTTLFLREFNRSGMDGLLNRTIQISPQAFAPGSSFQFSSYIPATSSIADDTVKKDINDFSFSGSYSIYNWELFFHAPLMVACRLMQNQKFEDAMTWFHYIFNPTNVEDLPTPQRYWVTKAFFETSSDAYRQQRIENILSNIDLPQYKNQLIAWKNNPFKPHLIARYRPVAYQKTIVMKYLDNLIAWGDMLFKLDTLESINEASLLYMLAYEILGGRPEKVPNVKHEDKTFKEIEGDLDAFANTRIDVVVEDTLLPIEVAPAATGTEPLPKIDTSYFCIPNNDYLAKYWDTVEDRLFKIRHCMNMAGVVRQLPLFEPPIDPALLVKAAAAGIDLSSVLNDLSAPVPNYRFRIVIQKAIEFCNDVKMLGEKLLSALEKRDAEELSLLRSQQEIQLLEAVKEVRKKQIDEAVETIGSLNKALDLADAKKSYYENKDFVNTAEGIALTLLGLSTALDAAIAAGHIIAGGLKAIPKFMAGASGFGGSPHVNIQFGGDQIGDAAEIAVTTISSIAHAFEKGSSLSSTIGSYQRRKEDWDFQGQLATIEKDQIQFQINAAEIRQAIAEKELDNQELQIDNTKAVDDYMRNKYTSSQLYGWMITQISNVYFQAYQLAYDMAKKAEKCFQYELGITSSNYVQFGYWDSLKKGLLSGDRLMTDIRRLEAAYIDQNKREFEITKHISLAQMFPLAFITLKETGKCTISLPEWLLDMDYPGHYMRRIKNVSVSIPCIVGPFTGVNCTLSLLKNETRMDATLSGGKYEKQLPDDSRFTTMFGSISSIATSSGQNDSGMFELNFNDDRYLPFEGAGVISDWQIDLPIENNYFDFSSLSDVILHIQYTSRKSGNAALANTFVQSQLPDSTARLFSLKHEFSAEWYKFLNPVNGHDQEFAATLKTEHFPFFIRGKLNTLKIKALDLFVETREAGDLQARMKITNGNYDANDAAISPDPGYNNVHHILKDNIAATPLGEILFKIKTSTAGDFKSLPADKIENIFMLLQLQK